MARPAQPTHSRFGGLIRGRREELGLSRQSLADGLALSESFVDLIERGKRGCDLDDLPRVAAALKLDAKAVVAVYLAERHAVLYHALYGRRQPVEPGDSTTTEVHDVHWRLDQLPRPLRAVVENLVYELYEMLRRPGGTRGE